MQSYFLAHDYDGSAFDTSKPSPNGITVPIASAYAVKDIFGDIGLTIFENQGGLLNRSPLELVHDIIDFSNADELRRMTELFVQAKLSYLIPEVSSDWPRPTKGFLNYWKSIKDLNETLEINVVTGIVSSGHDSFIRATFEASNMRQPDILITEDDTRGMLYPSHDLLIKPGPIPLAIAYESWRQSIQQHYGDSPLSAIGRVAYFGDDPHKDGTMARLAGAPFGLYTTVGNKTTRSGIAFSDWEHVAELLLKNQELLAEGKPLGDILTPANFAQIEGISNYAMRS